MAEGGKGLDELPIESEETITTLDESELPIDFGGTLSRFDEVSLSSCPEFELSSREKTLSTSQEQAVEKVLNIYRKLISFVKQEDFDLDLRMELNAAFKSVLTSQQEERREQNQYEYFDVFEMRMKDLKRMECGIAITGEVSSGKTSLINKLVGNMLMTPKHLQATSRIVRIINSDDLTFKAFDTKGNILKERKYKKISTLCRKMDRYTTTTSKTGEKSALRIDATCPFEKLQVKGNVMLVDTPGIGESADLTEILKQYLPSAVAFIFVIDVSHAGGVQDDRLLTILEEILQQKSCMPCFDLEDVLFVTNKWNHINEPIPHQEMGDQEEEDTDEEGKEDDENKSQKEKVRDVIERKLKEVWPALNSERIFKLSLKNVTEEEDSEEERMEFQRFCKALSQELDKCKNKRIERHLSLLDDTMNLVEKEIAARIHTATSDDEGQVIMLQSTYNRMKALENRCTEIIKTLHREIDIRVSRLTQNISKRLNSAEGREAILNPPGRKPIEKCFFPEKEVPLRFREGLLEWMKGKEVLNEIDEIENKISDYFEEVNLQIDKAYVNITGEENLKQDKTKVSTVLKYVITAPFWFPLFVVAGALSLVGAVVLSPFFLVGLAVRTKQVKELEIDACYQACLSTIKENEIRKSLDSIFKKHFEERINTIFIDKLPKEIASAVCTLTFLMLRRKDIKQNLETFLRLRDGIQKLRGEVKNRLKELEEHKKN